MSAAPNLSLVGSPDLPVYPIKGSDRLQSHYWFAFDFSRWDRSEFRIRADLEVKAVFLELVCAAQRETPLGTLPLAEDLLAHAGGVSLEVWRRLVSRPVGPLYGWVRCKCDTGEIRLMHKVVLEVAQSAMKSRNKRSENAEAERERKRLTALPEKILRAGGSERLASDPSYVLRLDQHLLDHLEDGKTRTVARVKIAMEDMETGERRAL